VLILSDKRKRG